MANANEMSPETLAIIERLKAEGQLIRNTGTNSIKTLKVDFQKFTGVLAAVRDNTAMQVDLLSRSLGLEQDRIDAMKRQQELDEVKRKSEGENETPPKPKPKPEDEKNEKRGFGRILADMFGTLRKILMKTALLVGGGILSFEFLRGFIDERTDGAFTRFFDDVDWAGMTTNFTLLATALKEKTQKFIDFLNDPLGSILNSNTGQAAAGVGAAAAGAGLYNILKGDEGDDDKTKKRQSKLKGFVRFTAMGLVSTGVLVAGEQVKDWIGKQEWSDDEIAGVKLGDVASGATDLVTTGAAAYTMAMMFGLGPYAIPAALAAVAIKGLVMIRNYIERKSNEFTEQKLQEFENNLDAALDTEGSDQVDNALAAYQAQLELLNQKLYVANEERAKAIAAMNARDTELMNALITAREFEIESMGQGESAAGPVANAMEAMQAFESQGRSRQSVLEAFLQNTVRSELTPEAIASLAADGLLRGYLESMVDPTQNPRLPATIAGDYATRMGAVDTLMAELIPMSFDYGPQNGRQGRKGGRNQGPDAFGATGQQAIANRQMLNAAFEMDDNGGIRMIMYDAFGRPIPVSQGNFPGRVKDVEDLLMRGTNLYRNDEGRIVIRQGDTNVIGGGGGGTSLVIQNAFGGPGAHHPGEADVAGAGHLN